MFLGGEISFVWAEVLWYSRSVETAPSIEGVKKLIEEKAITNTLEEIKPQFVRWIIGGSITASCVGNKSVNYQDGEMRVRISKQCPDIDGGVRVGKVYLEGVPGNQRIMSRSASEEAVDAMLVMPLRGVETRLMGIHFDGVRC